PLQQDPGPDGIVSVEAENYDANVEVGGHAWELTGPTGGFTGVLGMHAPNGNGGHGNSGYSATSERLEYEINFVKTGTHYVWILAWGADGTDDSCHTGLDGEETPLSDRMTGWSGDYEWNNDRYERPEPSQIEITSTGPHTFNIWVREDGLIIDKIVLTTNPSFTLSGSEPGPPESTRAPILKAYSPSPADGETYLDTWATLSWSPGATAASHDVYIGESFTDVNDGTGDTFRGNQDTEMFIVGFFGFPYPDGLVPGTTYYWRIDEVEADGTTKHKGFVWSFTIPPRTAYEPSPADGAKFVSTDVTLSWTAGFGAKLHYVYFGDNFDDVNNAVGGQLLADTTYTPGTLELEKTYYWRVDESDGLTTYEGDVWSFTTLPDIPITDPNLVGWWKFEAGAGTRVIDFSGHDNHGTIVDNVQWVPGQFNLGLEFLGDDEGHVELLPGMVTTAKGSILMWVNTDQTGNEGMFWYGTETDGDGFGGENEIHIHNQDSGELGFHIEGATDVGLDGPMLAGAGWNHVAATWDLIDGCRLYFNGGEVDSEPHNTTEANLAVIRLGRPVDTGNGNRYHDGLMDDVRLFDHAISAAQVSEIMSKGEDPLRAGALNPANNAAVAINEALPLSWSPGEDAVQHDVYFGTDRAAVEGADASDTTGVYRGRQSVTSYTPPEGVELGGGPYYWRIDEFNNDGTITRGGLWSFTVADYGVVEDFESYNDIPEGEPGSNLVYLTWKDGYDDPATNGSTMGYPTGASMETGTVHGGRQSAPVMYNNIAVSISEVERSFAVPQNWTNHGFITLSLWFFGATTNMGGQMYVKVNGVEVAYDGDAGNLRRPVWQVWNIDLTSLGANAQSVSSVLIGIRGIGSTGTLLFDDIRLYPYPGEVITPVQPDPAG
ncbi:MAG: LamG-like jellyroll fold domain-containing protein, partial [Planctomycetota bacterium]